MIGRITALIIIMIFRLLNIEFGRQKVSSFYIKTPLNVNFRLGYVKVKIDL